jgi:dolichol kinase
MIPIADCLNIPWVVGAILLLMAVAEFWFRLGKPPVEYTRKLVHLGSGFISLSFGFLFSSHWSVLALCILFVALMLATQRMGFLKSVHAVQRKSYGAFYFPLATYLTFLFSWFIQQPIFYFIAIAVLSTSDTIAALVGKRYGLNQFHAEDEQKSLEGSVMFFLSCYLIVHIAILLGTDISRINSVLIAFWVAFLATLFEALSIRGTDNFWIPIGTCYLLWKIVFKSTEVILTDLTFLAASVVISLLVFLPKRKLDLSAVAGVGMLLYSSMRLPESWNWGISVLTAMLLFCFGGVVRKRHLEKRFQVRAVFYSLGATVIWVIAGNLFSARYEYIKVLPFLITLGAILSIGWGRVQTRVYRQTTLSANALKYTALRTLCMTFFLLVPQLFFYEKLRHPLPFIFYIASVFIIDRITAALFFRSGSNWTFIEKMRIAFCVTLSVSCIACLAYANMWS